MPKPLNTPERLWSKVDVKGENECWPWKAMITESGYGRVWINDKGYYAHRVIYELANPGSISLSAPKDRFGSGFLRHKCDNPPCCNPAHLEIGTQADNMQDKVKRGRSRWFGSSVNSPRAKFTADEVREIRFLYSTKRANQPALAKLYEVSESTIGFIVYRRYYADID